MVTTTDFKAELGNTSGIAKARTRINRLAEGKPIVTPSGSGWDGGYTLNAASVRISGDRKDLIAQLTDGAECPDGVVAVLFRAQPRASEGFGSPRSSVGLSVFTPDFELIKRWDAPVLEPAEDPEAVDHCGVEDPRVVELDGTFYLSYCGFRMEDLTARTRTCVAKSTDLIHWEKMGAVEGEVNSYSNKDGVLFPEKIDGHYVMLHRPMTGGLSDYHIRIAVSQTIDGPWHDRGEVLRATAMKEFDVRWLGAGGPPVPLGGGKYLMFYHTGNMVSGERTYTGDAAILDLSEFTADSPILHVQGPLEWVVTPETVFERCSPYSFHDDTLHCVFPCGNYVEDGKLVFTYGGGDAYVLAASLDLSELVDEVVEVDARQYSAAS